MMLALRHMLIAILVIVVSSTSAAIAQVNPVAPSTISNEELLERAATRFQMARESLASDPERARSLFLESIADHQAIIDRGVVNGRLYYNIANAYLLSDDVGRALLNYRRAERLMPTSRELQTNIAVAKSRVPDRIEAKAETRVVRTLLFWHFNTQTSHRWIVLVSSFGALWIVLSMRLLGLRRIAPRWLAATAFLGCLVFGASVAVDVTAAGVSDHGVIVQQEVVGRTGPGVVGYEPSFERPLHAGVEFTLIERRDTWARVELADGRSTWLPRAAIELL